MKKNLFKTMFIAAAALAFSSCSQDLTNDTPFDGGYNGATKIIKLTADIAETRTELDGHTLQWKDEDTFGILTSADGSTILQNIKVDYTKANSKAVEIAVAENAKYIYGYYPYNAELNTELGLASLIIEVSDTYTVGTTDSEAYAPSIDGYFPMLAAKTALPEESDNADVAISFKAADACLIEFNIYGGTDANEKLISLDLNLEADGLGASGDFKYDLTGDEPVWNEQYANGYGFGVTFDWYEDPGTFQINYPKLTAEKTDGIKVYGVVHNGTYESNQEEDIWYSPKLTIKTNIQTYICKFNELDCSADGLTVNINLSSSAIEHPAELAEIISVDAPNTFSADVKIKVDYEKIDWIAINATNTHDIEQTNGATTKGFDSKEFISNAKLSYTKFEQGANLPPYDNMPYMIYTGSMLSDLVSDGYLTVSDDFLHFLGNQTEGVFDTPGDSNPFAPNTSYTVAIYVKPQSQYASDYPDDIIYTYEWTTPAIKYNGTASVSITDPEVSGANATATVSATNCSKIAAFTMLIDEAAVGADGKTKLTDEQRVDETHISDLLYWKDNKFKVYDGDVTLTYDNMLVGSRYMFIAVGIDENGLITKPVYKIAQPGTVSMTEEAKITGVEIKPQTSIEWLPITITATNASEVRYLAYNTVDYTDQDLNGTEIQSRLMNLSKGAGGWSNNTGKSGDEFTFYNGQGIYLSGNQDVSSDSEEDPTENPGGHTYYIFFAPVVDGSDGWKLGHIQLLTGNGSNYELYDITANDNNVLGNYLAAKRTELEDAGKEEEEPEIWSNEQIIDRYLMSGGVIWIKHKTGYSSAQKVWVVKITSADGDFTDASAAKAQAEAVLAKAFEGYTLENPIEPSGDNVVYSTDSITSAYPSSKPSISVTVGDVYAFISQDSDNVLHRDGINLVNGSSGQWLNW